MDCCGVKYPMTVLRLNSAEKQQLCDLAGIILAKWRKYSDPEAMIFAETDGEPHNTITPIARMRNGKYELDLVLRNNLTTPEHPMGLYHPHEELHHIKKENIGLIEVMGLAILPGRLKKEMNGAVAEAMQRRGLNYPLNYGVSVPTIRSIAGEYGTSHSLAMLLYRQQVRELKLAAAFVDDPQQVTPDQMRLWADGFANTELVEQVVYNLFRKAPGAERVALEWLDSPKPLLRYAGLLTAASTVRPEMEQTMRQAFFDRIDQLVFREIDSSAVLRGIVTALRQLARTGLSMRRMVEDRIAVYGAAAESLPQQVAEELRWQLEYLDTAG